MTDIVGVAIVFRVVLGVLGVMAAWISVLLLSMMKDRPAPRRRRRIGDLRTITETHHVSGRIGALSSHEAVCSSVRCVQSSVGVMTRPADGDATWTETPYFLFRYDAFQIVDESGALTPPSTMRVAYPPLASKEFSGDDLPAALEAFLLSAFGPACLDDLKTKRVLVEERFVPLNAEVHAEVEVRVREDTTTSVVLAVTAGPLFEFEGTPLWVALRGPLFFAAAAVILVSVAITAGP